MKSANTSVMHALNYDYVSNIESCSNRSFASQRVYYALSLTTSKQCLKSIDVDFINAEKVSASCSCSQIAFMAFHFYLILHMQFTSFQSSADAPPVASSSVAFSICCCCTAINAHMHTHKNSFQTFFYTIRRSAQMKQHFLSRKCDLCAFECKRRTATPTHTHRHTTFSPWAMYSLSFDDVKTARASEKLEAGQQLIRRRCRRRRRLLTAHNAAYAQRLQ